MNEQDLNAFEAWFDPDDNENYLDCWQACCEYKDKQYQTLYDNARVTIQQEQDRCREQLAAKDAMIARLYEAIGFVRESFAQDYDLWAVTWSQQFQVLEEVLTLPNDDGALREYAEDYLNKSPEIALLNEIGALLESVDYQGSYVDGIQALVKQAKREGQAEMRERAAVIARHYGPVSQDIRALPIKGENDG